MAASYEQLKSAFLALQRLAPSRRDAWLDALAARDASLHRALRSFLAFEADEDAALSVVDDRDDVGPEPLEGTRYADRGLLGVGGIGEVRRVYDPSLDRAVALKFLRSRHVHEPDPERRAAAEQRFVAEARIQASFHHPAILPVYERGTLPDGRPYLTMAEARGRTLRQRIDAVHAAGEPVDGLVRAWVAACEAVQHAHAQGVLHRDLKPSNVMVDEAGEAVVVDWGLALGAGQGRTGSLAGTPGYMAPEQLDPTAALDERADVYALGAVLHAILSGTDPEPGRPVADAGAPEALVALAARAMSADPGSRPESAGELARVGQAWLEGLDAPTAPSRTWAWGVAGLVAAVAVGAVLVASVWPDAGAAEAMARLEALRTTVAEHRAAGDEAAADRAFQAFVDLTANEGTAALAEAWLDRAEVLGVRGEDRERRRALATAFAESRTGDQSERALLALVRAQGAGERWTELAATLEVMQRRAPDLIGDPGVREAAWRLAIASRRLGERGLPPEGPLADLEPMLTALTAARRLPGAAREASRLVRWDADGDGWPGVWEVDREGLSQRVPGLDRGAPARVDWPEAGGGMGVIAVEVDGEDCLLVPFRGIDGGGARMRMLAWTDGALEERGSWTTEPRWAPVIADTADVDADGQDEILLGYFAGRRVRIADRDASGTWRVFTPGGSTNRSNSEVRGLAAEDFDRDGRVEVAAALGPWGAYDIRVLELDPGGDLELVSRRKLGPLHAFARVRGPLGLELATLVNPGPPRPRDFPAERPAGSPPGLYRIRVEGGALSEPRYIPLSGISSRILSFDVDGDGVDEVAVQRDAGLWLGRFDRRGALVGVTLTGLQLTGAADVDRDGRDELIVWDAVGEATWVLGSGEEALPVPSPAERPQALPLPTGWLADGVSRADDLFAMGFPQEGAQELEGLAALVEDPVERARLLFRAARYLELDDRPEQAGALYTRAAALDPAAIDATRGAARCAERLFRFRDAQDLLRPVDPAAADALEALAAASRWTLDLDTPLAGTASHIAPIGLGRDPDGERLDWTASGGGILLRVPMRRTGERMGLKLLGELRELAWSSGLSVSLRPAGADAAGELGLWMHGHGGGGHVETMLGGVCGDVLDRSDHRVGVGHAPALGRVSMRVDCLPEQGQGVFELEGPGVSASRELRVARPLPDGEWELVVQARDTADGAPLLARFALDHLEVIGAEPAGVDETPAGRAADALVHGEPRAALDLLDGEDVDDAHTRALALVALGRTAEAVDGVDLLADDPWARAVLRTHPEVVVELARRRGVEVVPALWAVWQAEAALRPDGADVVRTFTEGPLGTLPLDEASPGVRAGVLGVRARAWRHQGNLARARDALDRASAEVVDAELAVGLAVEAARVALLGDAADAALDHLRAALAQSPAPEVLADRLLADPAFADLREDPRWRDLPGVTPLGTGPSEAR